MGFKQDEREQQSTLLWRQILRCMSSCKSAQTTNLCATGFPTGARQGSHGCEDGPVNVHGRPATYDRSNILYILLALTPISHVYKIHLIHCMRVIHGLQTGLHREERKWEVWEAMLFPVHRCNIALASNKYPHILMQICTNNKPPCRGIFPHEPAEVSRM